MRLISQQVALSKFNAAKELVAWMGAMQAQDYNMAKWAIGIRLPGATNETIETAIDKGDIIRTHLLRPTWHFVSADDLYWMLELTAPQIKALTKSRNKELELTDAIFKKSNKIIEKALIGNKHLTREEIMAELIKAKIQVDDNRSSHLMLQAELDGIVCSGATKGNKQTYALLHERVAKTKSLTKDEALARLAERYFSSHCPARLTDFIWWSGLSVANARHALEMVTPKLISETINEHTYWLANSFSNSHSLEASTYLLPAYDEYLISYKDRTASLSAKHNKRSISINGIFKPVIIVNGQVIGTWKRTIIKDKVVIETEYFKRANKAAKNLVAKAAATFGNFIGKKTEMSSIS